MTGHKPRRLSPLQRRMLIALVATRDNQWVVVAPEYAGQRASRLADLFSHIFGSIGSR